MYLLVHTFSLTESKIKLPNFQPLHIRTSAVTTGRHRKKMKTVYLLIFSFWKFFPDFFSINTLNNFRVWKIFKLNTFPRFWAPSSWSDSLRSSFVRVVNLALANRVLSLSVLWCFISYCVFLYDFIFEMMNLILSKISKKRGLYSSTNTDIVSKYRQFHPLLQLCLCFILYYYSQIRISYKILFWKTILRGGGGITIKFIDVEYNYVFITVYKLMPKVYNRKVLSWYRKVWN